MKFISNQKIWENIFICLISLMMIFTFLLLDKSNIMPLFSKNIDYKAPEAFDINNEINNYKSKYNVLNVNSINNTLTNIVFKDEYDQLQSVIINNETGKIIEVSSMFKDPDFVYGKINELLSLKYAKYIVDEINNNEGTITYEFKNNELIVYYSDYIFNPVYNKDIILHVNYNEIDNYLNFKHYLDSEYENEDGYQLDPKKTTIAITFDDGPNEEKTLKILKQLEDYKMSATFFMLGNKMDRERKVVETVAASHSEIGSHTYSHINMKKVGIKKVKEELEKTNSIYKEITGLDLKLVRPPYGSYTNDIIKGFSNSFILWNVDTNDWRYKDINYLQNYILDNIKDGNIILMHDSYDSSVETVLNVLPILYSQDIQVVSVSKLAELKGIKLLDGHAYGFLN